jgi:protein SCO1/2
MNRLAMPAPTACVAALCLALLALAGCDRAQPAAEAPLAGADIGGPFELVDTHGKTVRWSDFAGRYRIVYFGYTYCPDVCPTDVQRMSQGLREFEQAHPTLGSQVQPIFISIDPERDRPKVLGEFIANFHPRLIGLTGSPEQVKQAAGAFRIYYEKGPALNGGGYMMNHSSATYLFGRNGEPLALLPTDKGADAVTKELARWVS